MLKNIIKPLMIWAGVFVMAGFASAQHKIDVKQLIEKIAEFNPESKLVLENQPELAGRLAQFLHELPPDLNQDLVVRMVADAVARYGRHGDFEILFHRLERELRLQRSRSFPNLADVSISKMNNASLTAQEQKIFMTILEDFQVNENAGPSGAGQYAPAIAVDMNGNFIICWQDEKNGFSDIYARQFDNNGVPLGSSFKVNDDLGSALQSDPAISADVSGNFVICWEDDRNGSYDTYAQRYDNKGMVQGSNFKVNDDIGTAWQLDPAISTDGSGNFVICWEDYRNGDVDIYTQRFRSDGVTQGPNFKVNDDFGNASQRFPAISMDGSGNFVICWTDRRNGNDDIYAQQYASDGTILGTNFKVNDDLGSTEQTISAVAIDGNGSFVICWTDRRNGNYDIYAQRFNGIGIPQGSNFKINDDFGSAWQLDPKVGIDANGNFMICWEDFRSGHYDIFAQRYNSNGILQGPNFKINDDIGNTLQADPSIGIDLNGNFVICWRDDRNGDANIYSQRYNNNGVAQGSNFIVNDDLGSASQKIPTIGVDGNGSFVICWKDERNGNSDIYVQRYDRDGVALGVNFKTNDDSGTDLQENPAISVDANGKFVICWEDYRNNDPDIYAQRFNGIGIPQGSNFKINDDFGSAWQLDPKVGIDANGNFVICWVDDRNGIPEPDIFAQRYDNNGVAQGANFKVNDDNGNDWQLYPAISVDSSGNFVICWADIRSKINYDIYAQRFRSDGVAQGTNFKVNDDAGIPSQEFPEIAVDGGGSFVICWQDNRNGNYDIYAQQHDNNGITLGANFKVNDDAGSSWQQYPAIGVDSNGDFVICWQDSRNASLDIYAQRYDGNGIPLDINYRVNNDVGIASQLAPAAAVSQSLIYFAWEDNRIPGQGWDIFARVEAFDGATAPDLLFPAEGSIITTDTITFTWSNTDANRYELFVDNDSAMASPEISPFHIDTLQNYPDTTYTISGNWLQQGGYYWKVVAFFPQDTVESAIGQFTYDPQELPLPYWAPLYRMYKGNPDYDHFYNTSDNHRQIARNNGYVDERTEGYVSQYRFNDPDMVPMFRFYHPTLRYHYYTTDDTDRDNQIIAGLIYEGIIGYAYANPQADLVPLYYLKKVYPSPPNEDHFYTISEFEKDNAQSAYNFVLQPSFSLYVSPDGAFEEVPVYESHFQVGAGINTQNGNFNHYTKTSFNMASKGIPLVFEHIYNSLGKTDKSSVLPLGPGWSHTYNAYIDSAYQDNKIAVFWPDGMIHLYQNNGGNFDALTCGVYDEMTENGGVFQIKKKDQTIYTFQNVAGATPQSPNEPPRMLTSIQDRNGNTIILQYTNGKLTKVTGTAGRELQISYFAPPDTGKLDLISQVFDPNVGRTVFFGYDVNGNLSQYTDPEGRVTTYSYSNPNDQSHLLEKITLPEGNEILNIYDYNTRKLNSQSWLGNTLQLIASGDDNIVQDGMMRQIKVMNQKINCLEDTLMRPLSIIDLTGGTGSVDFTWDAVHETKPAAVSDKLSNVTQFVYDAKGNVLQAQMPLQVTHTYLYDAMNNLTQYTNPDGKTIMYGYDANGNLTSITDQVGRLTTFTYTPDGLVQMMTDPLMRQYKYTYDNYGNIQTFQDPLFTTQYQHDNGSRLTQVTNPKSQTTMYSYNNNDLLLSITDANSGVTNYAYDLNDNLKTITDSEGQTTTWGYTDDLLTSVQNAASQVTSYSYQNNGRISSRSYPNGTTANYSYDSNGRLQTINYGSNTVDFTHDNNGNIIGVSDAIGSMSFMYDALNRMNSHTDHFTNTINYTLNKTGTIASVTYPGNKAVNYTYYDDDRLHTVSDWLGNTTTYLYRGDGSLQEIQLPNGAKFTYSYDPAGRLTGVSNTKSDATVIASYTFTLDQVGNITSEQSTTPLSLPILMPQNISYNYQLANRLQSAGSTTFNFDANGNTLDKDGADAFDFTYDEENRLMQITKNSTVIASYRYDGFGILREATRNGVATRYVVDVNGPMSRMLMETDAGNNVLNYYVYGLGLLYRIKADGTVHYYHYDNRGNTIAMTDQNETITHKYVYSPFGQVLNKVEPDANPFKFVGQFGVMDEGDDFYFMRARFYDAEVGRFVSEDPVWDLNLYVYANNSPIILIDPTGTIAMDGWLYRHSGWADNKKVLRGAEVGYQVFAFGASLSPFGAAVVLTVETAPKLIKMMKGELTATEALKQLPELGFSLFTVKIKSNIAKKVKPIAPNFAYPPSKIENLNFLIEKTETIYEVLKRSKMIYDIQKEWQ